MPKVHFINEFISVDVPHGAILREVAEAQGVEIYRGMWTHINCRGLGICGRCRIWVLSSKSSVSKPTLIRERLVHRVHGDLRLACQVKILGDVEIRTRPIGPAVVKPVGGEGPASYKEAAEQRYIDTLEAQKLEAKKKAEEARKKKEEEARKAEEEARKAEETQKAQAEVEALKAEEAKWADEGGAPEGGALDKTAAAQSEPSKDQEVTEQADADKAGAEPAMPRS